MYIYTVFEQPNDWSSVDYPFPVEGFLDPVKAAEYINGNHDRYFIMPIFVDSEPECEYPECDCEDECRVTGVGIDVEATETNDFNAVSGELLEASSLPTFKAKIIHVHYHA